MENLNNKKNKNENNGEFIPTFFTWMSLDEQKKRAKELDKKTKKVNINESK